MRSLLAMAALLVVSAVGSADAATVSARARLVLRERPSTTARAVERIAAGQQLALLGRSADGEWVRVAAGRREGWLPAAQVAAAAATAAEAPLAARRKVRPEAWVTESRYHDGLGPSRVTVVARAELVARPSDGAAVVGSVRKGEQLVVVRASRDGRWYLIEQGAGEVAWLPARAARGIEPVALAPQVSPIDGEADALPPTTRKAEPVAAEAPSAPPPEPVSTSVSPTPKKASRARRQRVAFASSSPRIAVVEDPVVEAEVTANLEPPPPYRVRAEAGAAVSALGQRFTSNARTRLANYEAQTAAFAVDVALAGQLRLGRRVTLGLGGAYRFAGAASLSVPTTTGANVLLAVQAHHIEALASVGYRVPVAGGITLSAGAGMLLDVNLITQDQQAPLPSERILALALAARVEAPALWRGLGARVELMVLPAGERAQTGGLGEGQGASTIGVGALAALGWTWRSGLAVEASGRYSHIATRFNGPAERIGAITRADRTTTALVFGVGLAYSR